MFRDVLNQRAPALPIFEQWLKDTSHKRRRFFYQVLVFILTFISYTLYHVNKRPFSVIKSVLSPECNVTRVNNTCHPWKPLSGHRQDRYLFSILDFTFMITYSLSLLASGYIAENTNLRIFLSVGMLMTGVSTALFGLARYFAIHSLAYFVIMQILAGITQSTGLPCVTEAVGMWFPKGQRGTTYGFIGLNSFIGNIIGSAVAGHFAASNWGLSFIVPAILIICFSVPVYLFLIPNPNYVNIYIDRSLPCSPIRSLPGSPIHMKQTFDDEDENENGNAPSSPEKNNSEPVGIGLWEAWQIPGVKDYSLSVLFVKLIGFTFFFWLPYFIRSSHFGNKTYTASDAAYYSIFFDIGGGFGGILAGIIYDYTDSPAIICTIMLICAAPNLLLFMIKGTTLTMFLVYMFLTGCFAVGPILLIISIVSAKLGSQESIDHNMKSIAIICAIFDAFGSVGGSIGPFLAGVINAKTNSWKGVVSMLIACDIFAAIVLGRQCYKELIVLKQKFSDMHFFDYKGKDNESTKDASETDNLLSNTD